MVPPVLAEGNKWDFFPSMALGWRMEQESWLRDVTWLEQLKLRLGVGVTGNAAVSPYGTLGVISSYWQPFSTGNSQIFVTNEPYYTSGSNAMPNKNLGWEKTTSGTSVSTSVCSRAVSAVPSICICRRPRTCCSI